MSLGKFYDVMIRLTAQDGASNVFFRVEQRINKMASAIAPAVSNMNNKLATLGLVADGVATVTNALKGATEPFIQFEDHLAKVSAITGIIGKQLDKIGDAARENAIKFGTSAAEQADMFQKIVGKYSADAFLGDKGDAYLKKIGEYTNKLAAVSDMSRDYTALALAGMTMAYKVNFRDGEAITKRVEEYANILTASTNAGGAELPQLLNSFNAVGSTASLVNFSFLETTAALQTMAIGMKTGEEAGVALRNMFINLATPLRGVRRAYEQLGLNYKDMNKILNDPNQGFIGALEVIEKKLKRKDKISQGAIVGMLFGKENVQAALTMIKNLDEYRIYLKRTEEDSQNNALDNAANRRMNTVLHHTEQMISRINDKLISFGKNLSPPFIIAANVIEKFMPQLIGLAAIKFLMPEDALKKMRGAASGVLHHLGTAARGIETTFARVQLATSRLATTMLAPLGRVRTATAAMMASAFAPLRSAPTQLAMFVQPKAVSQSGKQMTMFAPSLLERMRGFTRHSIEATKSSALFGNGIKGFGKTLGTGVWSGLTNVTKAVWAMNTAFLSSPVFWIVAGLSTAALLLWQNWDKVSTYLKGFWKGLSESLTPVKKAWDKVAKAFEPFVKAFDSLFAPSKKSAGALKTLGYAGQAAGKLLASVFNTIVPPVLWVFSKLTEGIAIFFGLQEGGSKAGKTIAGAISLLTLPVRGLITLFSSAFTFIGELLAGQSLKDALWNFGKSILGSFLDAFAKIFEGAQAFVGGMKALFSGEFFQKESPAMRFSELQQQAEAGIKTKRKLEERALQDASLKQAKEQQQGFFDKVMTGLKKFVGLDDSEGLEQLDLNTGKAQLKLRRLNKRLKADYSWIDEQNRAAVPLKSFVEPIPLLKALDNRSSAPQNTEQRGIWREQMPSPKLPEWNTLPKDLRFPDVFPNGQTTTFRFPEIGRSIPFPMPQVPTVTLPDIANNRFQASTEMQPLGIPRQSVAPAPQGSTGGITITFGDIIVNGTKAENPERIANDIKEQIRRALDELGIRDRRLDFSREWKSYYY